MEARDFIRLQMAIFVLIIVFGVCLLSGLVKIPAGPEGEWFTKIWEMILLVGNLAGLSMAVKYADETVLPKGAVDEKTSVGISGNSGM